jgi:hypothetical protein
LLVARGRSEEYDEEVDVIETTVEEEPGDDALPAPA